MIDFNYHNPAEIAFGKDVRGNLERLLVKEGATSLLMVYSGTFVEELGIYQIVEETCKEQGISFRANGNVVPNPEISLVRELVELGRREKVDFVLAVGGGSSIDTAKATALGIPYDGDVWDFFANRAFPERVLPVGVIATLPASGSETSNAAILSNGPAKVGFEDNQIIPRFAIMNPEYTLGLPDFQTACGTADILSHLLERYFSDVPHTDVTDYLIEGGVRALLVNGRRLHENPGDYDARAEIQWLASIAHNNLLDTGRVGDWGSHRIEHELSAKYGITHGEGMAVVLPAWIRYAAEKKPEKPAQLAVRVFGVDPYTCDTRQQALRLAELLTDYFRELGLRTTLTELGIDESDFMEMALRATKDGTEPVGHYLPLNPERFVEVLKMAL
ncbi:MAG: iron-containing alcohol dehydrogenase [Eubacterium sp.]|nr:iron-containing alcohol dehydrogenase [Eubacterium sp.]